MSAMAKKIVGTLATSRQSKGMFSKAGELILSKRSRLKRNSGHCHFLLTKILRKYFFIFSLAGLSLGIVLRVQNPE